VSFDIQIPELAPLSEALEKYPDIAEPIVRATTDDALLSLVPAFAVYPPELPHQRYKRTFRLQEGWLNAQPEWAPIASGFEAKLTNPAPYAEWVQSAAHQAKGLAHWRNTDQRVVDQHEPDITRRFDDALQVIADAVEGKH
jgi:hypothetical protein